MRSCSLLSGWNDNVKNPSESNNLAPDSACSVGGLRVVGVGGWFDSPFVEFAENVSSVAEPIGDEIAHG